MVPAGAVVVVTLRVLVVAGRVEVARGGAGGTEVLVLEVRAGAPGAVDVVTGAGPFGGPGRDAIVVVAAAVVVVVVGPSTVAVGGDAVVVVTASPAPDTTCRGGWPRAISRTRAVRKRPASA